MMIRSEWLPGNGWMKLFCLPIAWLGLSWGAAAGPPGDPLPSWADGPAKEALVGYVLSLTEPGSPDYLEPAERVAVTDNDGTLWAEKPLYPQVAYLLDAVSESVSHGVEAVDTPFHCALAAGDLSVLSGLDKPGLMEALLAPWRGRPVPEMQASARDFLATSPSPLNGRPYVELRYQPMLELLHWLHARAFRVYIVTGGGEDFVAAISRDYYGVPPARVLGTLTDNRSDASGQWLKGGRVDGAMNEGRYKVERIEALLDIRPVLALGNSDGDLEMLAHTADGGGQSLLLVHDDPAREAGYDRGAKRVMAAAVANDWLMVSMQRDFRRVFPETGAAIGSGGTATAILRTSP